MLDIKKISKTFNPGTVNEKKALRELSLHLDEGDFVTIVGSNGAGKSTLFNAIAGSFYVDEGSISLAGEDITFLPEHERSRRIGRLFQDPLRGTAPNMTIEENLALAAGKGTAQLTHRGIIALGQAVDKAVQRSLFAGCFHLFPGGIPLCNADVVLNGFCRTLLLAFLLALQLIFLRDDEIKQGKVIHAADLLRLAG